MRNCVLLLAALAAPVFAQDVPVYKADFTIRDSGDAGAKGGRKYSMLVNRGNKGTFRVGNRVPVSTEPGGKQFTYFDIGVNIECNVSESSGRFMIHADLDLSTAVNAEKNPNGAPTISQIKLNVDTTLTPAKPTVVASFDDPVTSRKFEVEATVTRVN